MPFPASTGISAGKPGTLARMIDKLAIAGHLHAPFTIADATGWSETDAIGTTGGKVTTATLKGGES